jgi:hypothetical protein
MKKTMLILGICAMLMFMPAITATPLREKILNIPKPTGLITPVLPEYDGTFVGGIGRLYKQNGEWTFDYSAYMAGVYKLGAYKKLYGYIYDLNEQQIGYIGAFFGHKLIYGYIEDMQNHRAPIVGFLIWNNQGKFAGRIMSTFGPAPHIIGEYTPNS